MIKRNVSLFFLERCLGGFEYLTGLIYVLDFFPIIDTIYKSSFPKCDVHFFHCCFWNN
jgi:hypothetical protein